MQIQTSEAALCCISEGPNLLYVSTFHRGPILYDMRVGAGPVATQNCHGHKSVFQMATEVCYKLFYFRKKSCRNGVKFSISYKF